MEAPKILVIRLSSLGDVILTAPVLRNLKAHWPGCRITLLVKPQFAAALEGHPDLDEIIPFRGLGDALRRIRSGGFTHLLDLHGNLRSFLLRTLAGVREVAVYRKDAWARRAFVALGLRSPALQRHTVERYLGALARWGVPARDWALNLSDYREPGRAAPRAYRSVLLIQSAFLGDTLLTLPLARQIKTVLPDCRLTVLTQPGTVEIFRDSTWVDRVIPDDKRGSDGGLLGPWRLARRLKTEGFDLALIPHRSLRSALIAWLAAIPRRIGFSTSAGRLLLTDAVPFTWLMHDLERNLALLKPLSPGLAARPDEGLYLDRRGRRSEEIARRLAADGVSPTQRLVGVHPGSAWPTKRWSAERFAAVARALQAQGLRVVLVAGKEDAPLCARIAEASGALDWAGKTDLAELRSLMGRLALFITNDSGPMHLAAACGVPTLAVFGPTTRELGFFPYGSGHRVLEVDLPCRPCGLHGAGSCPRGHFLCMGLITVEQVLSTANEMLANESVLAGGSPPHRGSMGL